MQAVASADTRSPEARQALSAVIWQGRHPTQLRVAAIDRLRSADLDAFWSEAQEKIKSCTNVQLIEALLDRCVTDRRSELWSCWLVRRSRVHDPPALDARVVATLLTLTSRPTFASLLDHAFATGDASAAAAAWEQRCRGLPDPQLAELVRLLPESGVWTGPIRRATRVMGRPPTSVQALAWTGSLQLNPAHWQRIAAETRRLPASLPSEIAPRHLAWLGQPSTASVDWNKVAAQLANRLAHAETVERAPAFVRTPTASKPGGSLSTLDAAGVLLVCDAARDPSVIASWFQQADADRLDRTTEYGGVLKWAADGRILAQAYAPAAIAGDRRYVASEAAVQATYRGLAPYHFHSQEFENADYAGPGEGDLALVEEMQTMSLVLTSVDQNRLNLDVVLPGRRVIDLGCIDRPDR